MNTLKTAVITGATKGIGKAIAQKLAAENFNLIICARNENDLATTKNDLLKINSKIDLLCITTDVSKTEERKLFSEKVIAHCNSIAILVNNAGAFLPGNIFDEPEGRLEFLLQTNLISAYEITRNLLPKMIAQKSGHIFNISSVAGLQAYKNGGSYSISKFALTGFSKNLREELKSFGIRVTALHPGAVLTDSWKGVDLPIEKFILPTDIANLIFTTYQLPQHVLVEDIVIRPLAGDIN